MDGGKRGRNHRTLIGEDFNARMGEKGCCDGKVKLGVRKGE